MASTQGRTPERGAPSAATASASGGGGTASGTRAASQQSPNSAGGATERAARGPGHASLPPPRPPRPSIIQLITSVFQEIPGLVSDHVHLVALELQRARQSLVKMVVLTLAAAILVATAWLALWSLIVVLLTALGAPWYAALMLVLVINLVAGWIAVRQARGLVDDLTLPATVRRLTFSPSTRPEAPPRTPTAANPPEPRSVPGVAPRKASGEPLS